MGPWDVDFYFCFCVFFVGGLVDVSSAVVLEVEVLV